MAIFFDRLSGLWALCLITAALIIFIPQLEILTWMTITAVLGGKLIYFIVLMNFFADYSDSLYLTHFIALSVQSLQLISYICFLYIFLFVFNYFPLFFFFFFF